MYRHIRAHTHTSPEEALKPDHILHILFVSVRVCEWIH